MERRNTTTVTVDRTVAVDALTDWFISLGLADSASEVVAMHVVAAEVAGRRSHGLRLVPALARDLIRSSRLPDDVRTMRREAGAQTVEGSGLPGIYVLHRAIEEALRGHADGRLVMSTAVRGFTGTTGCLGLYVHHLATAGITGLLLVTSPPIMAPPGGFRPLLGTNAVAFGAPTRDGDPIIGDFASSEVAYGDVALARDRGDPVRKGVMLDKKGNPTEDPSAIAEGALLPSGGHRGWCQALLVELLAGALAGGKVGNGPGRESALLLSFSPTAFDASDAFAAAADLAAQIHAAERGRSDLPPPRVPGDRFTRLGQSSNSLDVDTETLRRIESMGGPSVG